MMKLLKVDLESDHATVTEWESVMCSIKLGNIVGMYSFMLMIELRMKL